MAFIKQPDDQENVTPTLGGQSSVVDTTVQQPWSKVSNYLAQAQPQKQATAVQDVDLSKLPQYKALEVSKYNAPANYTAPVQQPAPAPDYQGIAPDMIREPGRIIPDMIREPDRIIGGPAMPTQSFVASQGHPPLMGGRDPSQPWNPTPITSPEPPPNPLFAGKLPAWTTYISNQNSPYANIMNQWENALQTQINTPPNAEHFAASDKIKDLNDQLYGLGKYATTGAVTQGQQEYWNQKNAINPQQVADARSAEVAKAANAITDKYGAPRGSSMMGDGSGRWGYRVNGQFIPAAAEDVRYLMGNDMAAQHQSALTRLSGNNSW